MLLIKRLGLHLPIPQEGPHVVFVPKVIVFVSDLLDRLHVVKPLSIFSKFGPGKRLLVLLTEPPQSQSLPVKMSIKYTNLKARI